MKMYIILYAWARSSAAERLFRIQEAASAILAGSTFNIGLKGAVINCKGTLRNEVPRCVRNLWFRYVDKPTLNGLKIFKLS